MKKKDQLPQGLSQALSQNPQAMQTFSSLPKAIRRSVINSRATVTQKKGWILWFQTWYQPPTS
jgi:uncharacterized protein YdeI (YjbR/CyaY-like superfamily)